MYNLKNSVVVFYAYLYPFLLRDYLPQMLSYGNNTMSSDPTTFSARNSKEI